MSYTITNNYTNLKLNLTTDVSNYTALKLNTYINDESVIYKSYDPVSEDGNHLTYNIDTSDYTIGDVITKFELKLDSDGTYLWETNEGIRWLVDGEEYSELVDGELTDTFHTNNHTFSFEDNGHHTIEAVFVGNDALKMASTGKYDLNVTQPPIDEEGSLENTGAYRIAFVNKNLKSMTYLDDTLIEFQLTKGGVPVPDRSFECVRPTSVYTVDSDKNGKGGYRNNAFHCGKYKVGAYYLNETTNKVITSTYKTITIGKGTPSITDNYVSGTYFTPSLKYKMKLSYRNEPIANAKITLYVNGKATTLTTNSKGIIYYAFKKKGTYKFKAVYKGNKDLKKVEFSRTITVVNG